MRKKFILKPTIWEFDFADEEALPTSSIGSCLDVSSKRVRRLSPVCGGATADTSMIEVAPPRPSESVPLSAQGKGAALSSGGPTVVVVIISVAIPRGFPHVNPLAPDVLPLLFSRGADRR